MTTKPRQIATGARAVGYLRCSTQEQVSSGLGLEDQEAKIRAYCALKGLNLEIILKDPGVSGGKSLDSRPGGHVLMNHARNGGMAIIALKLDRLFRDAADCLTVVREWDRVETSLHVIDLGGNAVDTRSAAGRFMLTVLAGAAEMERNLIRERTASALAMKAAKGERTGSVLYGWSEAEGGKLVPCEAEIANLAVLRSLQEQGHSLRQIATLAAEQGVLNRAGQPFQFSQIRVLLKRGVLELPR